MIKQERVCPHCGFTELTLVKEESDIIRFDNAYQRGRVDAINELSAAMYHQCFECNNDEDMQKWDSGNWFRYKLFENVINQLKE